MFSPTSDEVASSLALANEVDPEPGCCCCSSGSETIVKPSDSAVSDSDGFAAAAAAVSVDAAAFARSFNEPMSELLDINANPVVWLLIQEPETWEPERAWEPP
ncbi:unnamed protein product [Symbiodinium sp. CCMP2592]|nr:unnamed protein product [Symbiodinium sp. CCMP2592]